MHISSSSAPDLLRAAIGSEREAPPDPATLAPLFPDLEILGLLGQGGMGAVYRVTRRSDGRLFALKVVKPGPGQEDAFATRFAREAEALERLHHPNIVAIHGHGSAGPWCWLLMDLVDGANLREIVATGRLSPAQTLALVPPLCSALQYAHDQGVVHRDLKPENILLDAAGLPHLVDFGLAKLRDPKAGSGLTHTGATMGTVHYMAPEQVASAKGVDHRADIYALGVVVYELLTGQLPLGRFEVPSQRVQVDVRIDEVVLKALERDPERRWQQMRMVGQAVARMETAPSGQASVMAPWERWTLAGLAAILVIALLPGLLGSLGAISVVLAATCTAAMAIIALKHASRSGRWLAAGGILLAIGAIGWFTWHSRAQEARLRQQAEERTRDEVALLMERLQQASKTRPRPEATPSRPTAHQQTCIIFDPDVPAAARKAIEDKLQQVVTMNYDAVKSDEILRPLFGVAEIRYVLQDQAIGEETVTLHLVDDTLTNALSAIAGSGRFEYYCSAAAPDTIVVRPRTANPSTGAGEKPSSTPSPSSPPASR